MHTAKPKSPSLNSPITLSKECMEAFALFGDMPTLGIMYFLSQGPVRFNELERLTQTNPVTLTARLKKLTEQRIIKRSEQEVGKQSVSYSLDTVGQKMLPILQQIEEFSKELAPKSAK